MKMTESSIEQFSIDLLKNQGYEYIYGPQISPDSDTPERIDLSETLLEKRLYNALIRINPSLSISMIEDAIKQIERISTTQLINDNEAFHQMLTEGVNVSYQKDSETRGDLVWLGCCLYIM